MKIFSKILVATLATSALAVPVHAGGKTNLSVGLSFGAPCYRPYRPCYGYHYYRPYYPVYVAPPPVVVQPAPIVQPIVQPVVQPVYQQPVVQQSVIQQPVVQAPATVPPVVARASNIENTGNESALISRLGDADDNVRQETVMQLGRMKAQNAIDPLAATLAGDRSPSVRDAAARALGLIGSPKALPALQHAAQADSDRDVRHSAQFAVEVIRNR